MLVYDEHQFCAPLQALRTRLVDLAERACAEPTNLDVLRTLLIICGQVEQGTYDTLA